MRAVLVVALVAGLVTPAQADEPFAAGCGAPGAALTVGASACQRIESAYLGGTTAFGYYIPPACGEPGARCPVLYWFHGTGGDGGTCGWTGSRLPGYLLGPLGSTDAPAIKGLTHAPPVDVHEVADPWNYQPDTWVPAEPLDMILVAPYNWTVPGGYGPGIAPGGWIDWNPRYAAGGPDERYDTPPPRFESHILRELMPFVDTHFPTVGEREWRTIVGNSQGGLGSSLQFFRHPDLWANMGMISGAPIPGPWIQTYPLDGLEPDVVSPPLPPNAVPYQGPLPPALTDAATTALQTCAVGGGCIVGPEAIYLITYGMGDPVADSAYVRSHNPGPHMAANARAWAGDEQSSAIFYSSGDMVPTHAEELPDEFSHIEGEAIILSGNVQLEEAFDRFGIERTFFVRRGTHKVADWIPFVRDHWEAYYDHMRHGDGGGDPPPRPDRFDYRAIEDDFTVWGWHFEVLNRPATEFLYLTDVTCDALTMRGTGTVTVTPPASCGAETVTVDLGPSNPTDEPPTGASKAYGRTVRVELA